jgi:hypothetical protein
MNSLLDIGGIFVSSRNPKFNLRQPEGLKLQSDKMVNEELTVSLSKLYLGVVAWRLRFELPSTATPIAHSLLIRLAALL